MTSDIGIFEVIYNCRAMRRLKPDAVPEELLVKLIDAAKQAPTASNAQNSCWIIVRDGPLKKGIADLNRAAIDRSYGPPAAQVADRTDPAARAQAAFRWQYQHLEDVPAIIVACLRFAGPPPDTFAAGSASGGSVWPAVQNLLLSARALGLGATPTTLPFSDRAAFKVLLNIPENIEPCCVIPVGFPVGHFGPVTRRPTEKVMRWDRWS